MVSVGRCTVIKPVISERRETEREGSHSKIVLWHIDTLVINNPYYLLRARSQLAGDIISHKSPMEPSFCILLIVCIL